MQEISYCFALVEPSSVRDYVFSGEGIPSSALSVRFMSNHKVLFSQEPSKSENGLSWSQRFRATTKDAAIAGFNGRRLHIAIFLADGGFILVGNPVGAPLLTVTERENVFEVSAEFATPEPSGPLLVL